MDDTKWVSRFGNLAGIRHAAPSSIDRRSLAQHDARPEEGTLSYEGKRQKYLTWQLGEGSTSQSPASAWFGFEDARRVATEDVLRRMYEALELPGVAADYHFILLRACEILWSRRRQEPPVLPELERLSLLDIELVEKRPDIVRTETAGEPFTAHVPAFHYLVYLYAQEGSLIEARDIAKRAEALGQGSHDVEEVEKKLAAVEEEDA